MQGVGTGYWKTHSYESASITRPPAHVVPGVPPHRQAEGQRGRRRRRHFLPPSSTAARCGGGARHAAAATVVVLVMVMKACVTRQSIRSKATRPSKCIHTHHNVDLANASTAKCRPAHPSHAQNRIDLDRLNPTHQQDADRPKNAHAHTTTAARQRRARAAIPEGNSINPSLG